MTAGGVAMLQITSRIEANLPATGCLLRCSGSKQGV